MAVKHKTNFISTQEFNKWRRESMNFRDLTVDFIRLTLALGITKFQPYDAYYNPKKFGITKAIDAIVTDEYTLGVDSESKSYQLVVYFKSIEDYNLIKLMYNI